MNCYKSILKLNSERKVISGSTTAFVDSLKRGADLKIGTVFRHDEHMCINSTIKEYVNEISEFHETMVVDDNWGAGFMTLRQPANIPYGFGPRASMSLFMYNQDGRQATARPYLDGGAVTGVKGLNSPTQYTEHEKMNYFECYDEGTNAPSINFAYAFDEFDYMVKDCYTELLSHDGNGKVVSGSIDALVEAYYTGVDLKVGISELCDCMTGSKGLKNEIFVHLSYCYYYTSSKLFLAQTQPFVRVAPEIPLVYRTDNWDYCWAIPHTDGTVSLMVLNPYTLKFEETKKSLSVRWFGGI